MSLSDLEQHVMAYFVAGPAGDFTSAPRFYPYGELTLIWEDKVKIAVRKFGFKVKSAAKPAAVALLDLMIEKGAYSTTQNDFGGTMHQFQPEIYAGLLKDLRESDPIIGRAAPAGTDFWETTFAELTAQPAG